MQTVVQARNLSKTFGDLVAVDGVSFDVCQRECFGILGPNGAGKTTTIRMSYGFSPLSGGSLRIFDADTVIELRAIKSRIGACRQKNNLDPDLTVRQNLEVFARSFDIPGREADQRAEKLLQFIALDHRVDAKVTELSGGMIRRRLIR